MGKVITFTPGESGAKNKIEAQEKRLMPPSFLVIILADKYLAPSLRQLQKIINTNGENFDIDFKNFLAFREKESPEIQRKLLRYVYSTLIYLGKIPQTATGGEIETETQEFITKFSARSILEFKKATL